MGYLICRRCDGDIEFETDSVSNGDGVWAESYVAASVVYEPCALDGTKWTDLDEQQLDDFGNVLQYGKTDCGCVWTLREIDALDERATKTAQEPVWAG